MYVKINKNLRISYWGMSEKYGNLDEIYFIEMN